MPARKQNRPMAMITVRRRGVNLLVGLRRQLPRREPMAAVLRKFTGREK